jgi:hypothetical protein
MTKARLNSAPKRNDGCDGFTRFVLNFFYRNRIKNLSKWPQNPSLRPNPSSGHWVGGLPPPFVPILGPWPGPSVALGVAAGKQLVWPAILDSDYVNQGREPSRLRTVGPLQAGVPEGGHSCRMNLTSKPDCFITSLCSSQTLRYQRPPKSRYLIISGTIAG